MILVKLKYFTPALTVTLAKPCSRYTEEVLAGSSTNTTGRLGRRQRDEKSNRYYFQQKPAHRKGTGRDVKKESPEVNRRQAS